MAGDTHILFSENDTETFLDVKVALQPHLSAPIPDLSEIVFKDADDQIGNTNIDDSATVSSLAENHIVELQLFVDRNSKIVIDNITTSLPYTMEDALLNIRNNQYMTTVDIRGNVPIRHIVTIVNTLRENPGIERLILLNNRLDPNEMNELFEAISENNTLRSLTIKTHERLINVFATAYRMDDLFRLLDRNTSLRDIHIENSDVEFGDVREIVDALRNQRTLETLTLVRNRYRGGGNEFQRLRALNVLLRQHGDNIVIDGAINLNWTNPNL
jgi:hypothetical protein